MYQQFSPTFGSGRTHERKHEQRAGVRLGKAAAAACGGDAGHGG